MLYEGITGRIIDASIKVHSGLGPGLLESTYHACLQYEFNVAGLHYEHQVRLPVVYHGIQLDAGYRIDFLVENRIIVELKAVEKVLPLHMAQLISYLKLSGRKVGLLINFNVTHLRDGIHRRMNGYEDDQDGTSVSPVSSVVESSSGNGVATEN
jgi:GxxExxY protein